MFCLLTFFKLRAAGEAAGTGEERGPPEKRRVRGEGLAEEMLDIRLREDAEDGATVRGVVDVGAGEELVGNAVHLLIAKELTIGNGSGTGQREGEALMTGGERRGGLLGNVGDERLDEGNGVAVGIGGNGVDRIAAAAEVGKFETHVGEQGESLSEQGGLSGGEVDGLGKRRLCEAIERSLVLAR